MQNLILRQHKFESDTWKRLLSFMVDENIHLKNRLIELLKNIPDKNLLEEVENFQTRFIKQDGLISLLRHDVTDLDTLFVKETSENGNIENEITRKLTTLRNNITNAEAQLTRLIIDFNTYVSEVLNDNERVRYNSKN